MGLPEVDNYDTMYLPGYAELRPGEFEKLHDSTKCNFTGFSFEPETNRWVCGKCRKPNLLYVVDCDGCEELVVAHVAPSAKYGNYTCERCLSDD